MNATLLLYESTDKQQRRPGMSRPNGLTGAQIDSDAVHPQLLLGKSAIQSLLAYVF
jgi:hypothetical protein